MIFKIIYTININILETNQMDELEAANPSYNGSIPNVYPNLQIITAIQKG